MFKHLADERKLFALVPVDHAFDQRGVGEVVCLYLLVQHLLVALPSPPEVLAADLAIDDGVLAHGAGADVGFAHQF